MLQDCKAYYTIIRLFDIFMQQFQHFIRLKNYNIIASKYFAFLILEPRRWLDYFLLSSPHSFSRKMKCKVTGSGPLWWADPTALYHKNGSVTLLQTTRRLFKLVHIHPRKIRKLKSNLNLRIHIKKSVICQIFLI